jgi:hypothetical protein
VRSVVSVTVGNCFPWVVSSIVIVRCVVLYPPKKKKCVRSYRSLKQTSKKMPGTPTQRMRASAKKVEGAIASPRISEEEKERRKKEKEEKQSSVAPWVVGLLLFVVLGSSVVQIFFSIQTSPSMSDEK